MNQEILIQMGIGTMISILFAILSVLFLKRYLNTLLLDGIILLLLYLTPYTLLLLESPLNVDAMVFWLIPIVSMLVLIPFLFFCVGQNNAAEEENTITQKFGVLFLWSTVMCLAIGGLSLLVSGEDSEIGRLVWLLTFPLSSIFGVYAILVFASTVKNPSRHP